MANYYESQNKKPNEQPPSWQSQYSSESNLQDKGKNRFTKVVLGAGLLAVALAFSGKVQDNLTVDPNAVDFIATNIPNSTQGGMNAAKKELSGGDIYNNINRSEMGAAISEAIKELTGESERSQSGHQVKIWVEHDGDIAKVEVLR